MLAFLHALLKVNEDLKTIGALAGLLAVPGLAVLSLLYFGQAREVRRLREWAGRAPERAAEMEARVSADAARRVQTQPRPATAPATAAAAAAAPGGNGVAQPSTAAGQAQSKPPDGAEKKEGEEAKTAATPAGEKPEEGAKPADGDKPKEGAPAVEGAIAR